MGDAGPVGGTGCLQAFPAKSMESALSVFEAAAYFYGFLGRDEVMIDKPLCFCYLQSALVHKAAGTSPAALWHREQPLA